VLRHLTPDGSVFVGDVRNLALLEPVHASVEAHHAAADRTADALSHRVSLRLAQEHELVLAPAFFDAFRHEHTAIAHVDLALKRGRHLNELTRFRYDVTLRRTAATGQDPDLVLDWSEIASVASLEERLLGDHRERVLVCRIPNARVAEAVRFADLLRDCEPATAADTLRRAARDASASAVDPETLHQIEERSGYSVHVRWSRSGAAEEVDALFLRDPSELPRFPSLPFRAHGWRQHANDPLQGRFTRDLVPHLREHLQRRLPQFMVPSAFVLVDALPLMPNGKVDRGALPRPNFGRSGAEGAYIAPRTPLERGLARIWAEVLGIQDVGIHDNFFSDLGGHSLLGTQIVSRIKKTMSIDLPLSRMFEAPTIAQLAACIEASGAAGHPSGAGEERLGPVDLAHLSNDEVDLMLRALLDAEREGGA
jgi:acyl carrier protein